MAAYGRRILHGQVPHNDFISPRPIVSSVIHLPDFIVPLPLYLAGRLDGIAEMMFVSVAVGWLLLDRPPWRWGPLATLAVAASSLVNLHTFGETAWYTFDGLLFVTVALLLVRRGLRGDDRRYVVAGLLVAGLAVTTKQSFAPAPLILLAWLAWHGRRRPRPALARELVAAAVIAAAPMLLYLGVLAAFGALSDTITQLNSGRLVWGRTLFEMVGLVKSPAFGRPLFEGHFPWEVGLAALALLVARTRRVPPPVLGVLGVLVTALTLRLAFHQNLEWGQSWSLEVMWALILVVALRIPFERRVDWPAVAVLLLGWMTMLSWGYELPALVAGSMCLSVGAWALRDLAPLVTRPRASVVAPVAVAVMAALFVFTATTELAAREDHPYYDKPKAYLTESVGAIDPAFKGMRTAPATADYMRGLRDCLEAYPAKWVAIIPDNPGLYPALDLDNPFPIDWFWRNDYRGQREKIIKAAQKLDREGNYLVLIQTESGLFLQTLDRLPRATRRSLPIFASENIIYDPMLGSDLVNTLHGAHIVCGSFLGIYDPA